MSRDNVLFSIPGQAEIERKCVCASFHGCLAQGICWGGWDGANDLSVNIVPP